MPAFSDELWVLIFSFVCWNADLRALALTCRHFSGLILPSLWSCLQIETRYLTPPGALLRKSSLLLTCDHVPLAQRKAVIRLKLSKISDGRPRVWHERHWDFTDLFTQFSRLKNLYLEMPLFKITLPASLNLTSLTLDDLRAAQIPRDRHSTEGFRSFLECATPNEIDGVMAGVTWDQSGFKQLINLPTLRSLAFHNAGRLLSAIILNLLLPKRSLTITHLAFFGADSESQMGVFHLIEAIKHLVSLKFGLFSVEAPWRQVFASVLSSTFCLPSAINGHANTLEEFIIVHTAGFTGPYPSARPLARWPDLFFTRLRVFYLPTECYSLYPYPMRIDPKLVEFGLSTSISATKYDDLPLESIDIVLSRLDLIIYWKTHVPLDLRVIKWWIIFPQRSSRTTSMAQVDIGRSKIDGKRLASDQELRVNAWSALVRLRARDLKRRMESVGIKLIFKITNNKQQTDFEDGCGRDDWRRFEMDIHTEEEVADNN